MALIYLSSRLTKFEIQDWQGRPPHFKGKWWENIVEDVTLELLEGKHQQQLESLCPVLHDLNIRARIMVMKYKQSCHCMRDKSNLFRSDVSIL